MHAQLARPELPMLHVHVMLQVHVGQGAHPVGRISAASILDLNQRCLLLPQGDGPQVDLLCSELQQGRGQLPIQHDLLGWDIAITPQIQSHVARVLTANSTGRCRSSWRRVCWKLHHDAAAVCGDATASP